MPTSSFAMDANATARCHTDVNVTAKRLRCFVSLFNTAVVITAAILIAVGLCLLDKRIDSYFKYSTTTPFYAALNLPAVAITSNVIFVAFGASIKLLGFCSIRPCFKKPRSLLSFCIAVIITLMAGELCGGIYARVKLGDIGENIEAGIVNDLQVNYKSQSSLLNDAVMDEFKCCGWNGYRDFNFTSPTLPCPCCKSSSLIQCSNSSCSVSMVPDVYEGCGSLIGDALALAIKIFLGVGVGLALLKVIVLAGAIFMYCTIEQ